MRIYLDAGHGGSDPGAIGNGVREADVVLAIALRTADHLKRHGLEVKLSRTGNITKSLEQRTDEANRWGAHAFVSLHCNAAASPAARGFEVWHTIHEAKSKGDELAEAIAKWIDKLTPLNNRGTKSKASKVNPQDDYYHVIRETRMPAVIVECGFVSNAKDAAYLQSASGQAAIAQAIARGVIEWTGLPWRGQSFEPKQQGEKKFRLMTGTFSSFEDAQAGKEKLEKRFGWLVYIKEDGKKYRLMTGTFSSFEDAQAGKEKLEKRFGWLVYIVDA